MWDKWAKSITIICLLLLLLMFIFPPVLNGKRTHYGWESRVKWELEYGPIWETGTSNCRIVSSRLILQSFLVLVIGGIMILGKSFFVSKLPKFLRGCTPIFCKILFVAIVIGIFLGFFLIGNYLLKIYGLNHHSTSTPSVFDSVSVPLDAKDVEPAQKETQVNFYSIADESYAVVYLLDRSGSMIDTFESVCQGTLLSIGRLQDSQMFHIILFAEGRPIENTPRRLIPATQKNKENAAKFLMQVTPECQTDPVPAIVRAYTVLQGSKKREKLIYLLADGVFPDSKKVLKAIEKRNMGKNKVQINTVLYGTKSQDAVEVMTKIAKMTGGRYTFVQQKQ